MKNVYWVSGIDTGIGKTIVTGLMARYLLNKGVDVITVKMVQTGCVGFSEDIDVHRKLMGKAFPEDETLLTAPQIFKFPSSPDLAARLENKVVRLFNIQHSVAECAHCHDVVLVEGAGGLCVPLSRNLTSVDFVKDQGWKTILVSCGKLGSLNHSLLSLEALRNRKMTLSGLVYNWCDGADKTIDSDSELYLRNALGVIPLVRVPKIDLDKTLPEVDFSGVFKEWI